MKFQYYTKFLTKEYGKVLAPYSHTFNTRLEAIKWKAKYYDTAPINKQKLILTKAIEL